MTDLTRWLAWCRRAGLTVLQDLPRGCLVYVAVREGSSWSARSRAAARTNELDADERRTIMDSEEGSFRAGLSGVVVVPGVAGGVVSQAPIRRPAGAPVEPAGEAVIAGPFQQTEGHRQWPPTSTTIRSSRCPARTRSTCSASSTTGLLRRVKPPERSDGRPGRAVPGDQRWRARQRGIHRPLPATR